MSQNFKVGEQVVFINAANIAIIATVCEYTDADVADGFPFQTSPRLRLQYGGDNGTFYHVCPEVDRVGRMGVTFRQQVAKGLVGTA